MGWIIDHNKYKVYRSSMIVETNFNSVQQLYNNIEFYDELAREKEFKEVSKELDSFLTNAMFMGKEVFTYPSFYE